MKIIQINQVFPYGSTGKLVLALHNFLSNEGHDSRVFYAHGPKTNGKCVKNSGEFYSKIQALICRVTGIPFGGCFLSTRNIIKQIKRIKPDIVHLQCINGHVVNIYKLISWLKKNNVKTVITLHAEFIYTANCSHSLDCQKWKNGCEKCPNPRKATGTWLLPRTHKSWLKMKKAFDGFSQNLRVVSVSPWLMERAKQSPILVNANHCIILNGLDTNIFNYQKNVSDIRNELGLFDRKVVFYATPFFSLEPGHIKGGEFLVKLAERMGDVVFLVAGPISKGISVPANVRLLGRIIDQQKLAKLYSLADLTLITSKRETFSMVVAESLCCGTPVVGFEAGGPEAIAIPAYSSFVEQGNIGKLQQTVDAFLRLKIKKSVISKEALNKYSSETMSSEYLNLYKTLWKE